MADKLGIGIEAKLDTSQAQQGVRQLEKTLENVGKKKIDPVDDRTLRRAKELISTFETYLKLDREMARRLRITGQSGKAPEAINWDVVYQNERHRQAKIRQLNAFMHGVEPSSAPGGGHSAFGNAATNIAQTGLRATGAAGGVAAGAIGTGMSSGFGAGIGALVGGLAALAVGKVVGAVSEKIDQANENNVAYDRLKRTLGDVNVSFEALKTVITGSGDVLKITYAEAGQLATQFARLGNVSSDQYKTLADELKVGVGISRAYGLDPSQGVGVMGHMRGIGMTRDTQESKKFALLIGETISKSGAFANADHVMESIAQFATSQTRANMGRANAAGYAGEFSALYGSGIPGLDAAGSASLLSRVNASLTAGGAKGEASQFFTNMMGSDLGLDPFQMQVWREGGAFETLSDAFGPGSIASRYGMRGPAGDKTYLRTSLDRLKKQYGSNPGLLANATSNHLGVSMRQAMALLDTDPNKMGEMGKYADLTKLSESGIANMSKALYGTADERKSITDSLLGRSDVSEKDKEVLRSLSGMDEETQKQTLAKITAQYEQERTTGSDIRDSKNILDNILVTLADKIADPLAMIKAAIVSATGKSSGEVMQDSERIESQGRIKSIRSKRMAEREQIQEDYKSGKISSDDMVRRVQESRKAEGAEVEAETNANKAKQKFLKSGDPTASSLSGISDAQQRKNVAAFLDTIGDSESANYNSLVGKGSNNRVITDLSKHPNIVGMRTKDGPSTAAGKYQITNSTWRSLGHGPNDSFSPEEQDKAAIELIKRRGAWNDVLNGNWDAAAKKLGKEWQSLPTGASPNQGKHSWGEFHKQIDRALQRQNGTPMPEGASAGGGTVNHRISADDITIHHIDKNTGQPISMPSKLKTKVQSNWQEFGMA